MYISNQAIIAQICGWKGINRDIHGNLRGIHPLDGDGWATTLLPDYFNDLNAMHEAEKQLTSEEWEDYAFELAELIGRNHRIQFTVHATAAQRAEAFLRTHGRWSENEG